MRRKDGRPGRPGRTDLVRQLKMLSKIAKAKGRFPIKRFVTLVDRFVDERREESILLRDKEEMIRKNYLRFTPQERVEFLSFLYDRFAERYDEHMTETGHYAAIERVLQFAMPYLRPPIMDLTAGTGKPLGYALGFMDCFGELRGGPLKSLLPMGPVSDRGIPYLAHANEISPMMLEKARKSLRGKPAAFSSHDAYGMPGNLRGRFNTVLCSQTFHIISDDDKPRMAEAMRDALAPGGVAIVIEEDPFMISQSEAIDAVGLFLRAVVRPIRNFELLLGHLANKRLTLLDETASAPIDEHHAMKLHLFRKPE